MLKGTRNVPKTQDGSSSSELCTHQLYEFVRPLLEQLMQRLDRRLVQTFLDLLIVMVLHRERHHGLWLSELGGHLMGMRHAPAGTKRIANLLHSPSWEAELVEQWLWEQGDHQVAALLQSQVTPLVIWDESAIEKPESLQTERLCPVRSAKAQRLQRIKPGFYHPPVKRPVFVPGFGWFQVIVAGPKGAPCLAHFHWWTTRGPQASRMRTEEEQVLTQLAKRWGRQVIHVWDRGFVINAWIQAAVTAQVRFLVRWKSNLDVLDESGQRRKLTEISRTKRSVDHRLIYDSQRRCERVTGIVFFPVRLPDLPEQSFWMVVSRPGAGRRPWFLLTNEPVPSVEAAWQIVLDYNRRWVIETCIRLDKAELGIEGIRLIDWTSRQKLMLMVAVLHAFLLALLAPRRDSLRSWLLTTWCHRTGRGNRLAAPLYRLRLALSSLWLAFRPFSLPRLN